MKQPAHRVARFNRIVEQRADRRTERKMMLAAFLIITIPNALFLILAN